MNWLIRSGLFAIQVWAFCLAYPVHATTSWHIQPEQSSLTFTGTQNNAPVSGKFTQFSATILFDPQQLNTSKIELSVDMNSVWTSYAAVADMLKTAEWFNVKLFPQATFQAEKIEKIDEKNYRANGVLAIRDKTQPLAVAFSLEDYSDQKARVKGAFSLKRHDFGIGQGEWANTDDIKDEVKMNFDFSLVKT